MHGGNKIDFEKELNEEQCRVVFEGDGACLVLAGAGSGKTRTITYRVAYLLEQGVSPDRILLLTFTNKAAREMLSRIERLLGAYPAGLMGGTFHSVANRFLRTHAHLVGRTPNFTIIDQEDSRDLIKLCVRSLAIDPKERRFPSPAILQSLFSYARNAGKSVAEAVAIKQSSAEDWLPQIEHAFVLYEQRKVQADAMDFDDLLLKWRELLVDESFRKRTASSFEYVLVDEYQDTNVVQAQIVRALSSVHGNVLVVGDDAQSIYSFRAADIRNILGFGDTYTGAKTFRLTANYRSTPEILNVANASIRHNTNRLEKDLRAMRTGADKPQIVPAPGGAQEAQFIAEQILRAQEEGIALQNMAVLFRAAFQSQQLEMELMRRDIPYEYRGGMKFFERAHIKDVLAHVRLYANKNDEAAWMRTLGLRQGIGLTTAQKIVSGLFAVESLEQIAQAQVVLGKRAAIGWQQMQKTLQALLATSGRPAELIRATLSGDYRTYLETEYPDFRDRLDDLEQLALFAQEYDELKRFLDEVSLTDEHAAGRDRASSDRVVLSTIHQAKGLEWDWVFVLGLVEGKFPHARAYEEQGGMEEERRLFYVAVTRARHRLFFTYPLTSGYDTLAIHTPSQFLQELPSGICEQVRLKHAPISQPYRGGRRSFHDDEPMIVLNDLGEVEV